RSPPVRLVALLKKVRGREFLRLRLVLNDGTTRFIEEGEEMVRMRELAVDLASVLGVPVFEATGVQDHLSEAALTLLPDHAEERVWADLDAPPRRVAYWVLFVISLLFACGGTYLFAWAVWTGRLSVTTWPDVLGLAFGALVTLFAIVFCLVHGIHLGRRRPIVV